ncbi:MAG: sugar phosphate isomerase/epimerase [Candidatus Sumerlaeota bacterium]|nr:sugar phosphate isomerase/epimerase [Candidatus Sumerlaeota bacterium]
MKRILSLAAFGVLCVSLAGAAETKGKTEWRLGIQCWSYNKLTFYEAIDKSAALGVKYLEAYSKQKLSPEQPKLVFGDETPDEVLDEVKAKLEKAGLKLACYGVVGLPNDEAGSRKMFDFAKKMGIETIVSEPAFEALPMISKLADEYGINVAIHNHPKGKSKYWSPDIVLEQTKDLSKRIGACADLGHWFRSGIDPLDGLKKLEGRVISLHIKDLKKTGESFEEVPVGTGDIDIKGCLKELRRQGVNPVISLEYEAKQDEPAKEKGIEESIKNLQKMMAEL